MSAQRFLFTIDAISTWVGKAAAWLIIVLMTVVCVEVFKRYIMNMPTAWIFDVDNMAYGALFMLCGILPWTWFAASLTEASGSLIAGGNLIKKVLFPAEVLPIVSVLANMVHFFLALPIVAIVMIAYRHWPDAAGLLWLPLVVLVLIFQKRIVEGVTAGAVKG